MPSNADLLARRAAAVPRGVATAFPVFADKAENAELWDVEGKRYVDFAGGIAVLNTGHRHPKVMAAVEKQLQRFTHTAFQVTAYESYLELAEKINARAPFSGDAKTIFFTTGGEALENAVKIARAATGRTAVITFTGAFHGRTMLTMAMTGKVAPYKKKFGPLPAEVYHMPFPNELHGVTVEQSLQALQFLFRADVEPERVAAIVVEPVQGEGGFYETPTAMFQALRKICDEHGIVLIADEVQTGFGRTGKLFAVEHTGVEPDLVTMAKSLGGGFPISGIVGRAGIMDAPEPGGLGGTYAGSPIACAAALAVLDAIEEEKLLDRATEVGNTIKARLETISKRNDAVAITAIRGRGAMIGFDIVKTNGAYEPDADATKRVTTIALEKGLILLSCGVYSNVVRILVPLTVTDAVLEEGLVALEAALVAAKA